MDKLQAFFCVAWGVLSIVNIAFAIKHNSFMHTVLAVVTGFNCLNNAGLIK